MPLLGNAEKGQLEELILARLQAFYDENGPGALLVDGVRVVVDARGAAIDRRERELFTALCYLSAGTATMPRESLEALATEATSAAAAQINLIGAA